MDGDVDCGKVRSVVDAGNVKEAYGRYRSSVATSRRQDFGDIDDNIGNIRILNDQKQPIRDCCGGGNIATTSFIGCLKGKLKC